MTKTAKTILVEAEEYYSMRHKLFAIGEILVDESKSHITTETAIQKIRKVMRGDE